MSALTVGFDDMTVLSEGGVEVFLLNLDAQEGPPPYYVDVNDQRFHLGSNSFPIFGHSASLPRFVREHEEEGQLVLLVERDGRYLTYLHDPTVADEEDEADDEGADS
jgi:hypothetical protein